MSICIFGGSGFLGQNLMASLEGCGKKISVFDKKISNSVLADHKGVDFFECDMANPNSYMKHMVDCEYLCLFAASSIPGAYDKSPISEYETDVLSYGRLLDAVKSVNVNQIIYLSSGGAVYGPVGNVPICEEQRTRPVSSYGCGKLSIELLLERYEVISSWSYTILRPSNPIGFHQIKSTGSHGLVTTVLSKIIEGQEVSIWGNGSVVRDYFDARDLSKAVVKIIGNANATNQVFNVGSGQGYSVIDIINLCREITEIPAQIKPLPERAVDVPYNVLNINKIRDMIGWKPEISIEQSVSEIWRSIKNSANDL